MSVACKKVHNCCFLAVKHLLSVPAVTTRVFTVAETELSLRNWKRSFNDFHSGSMPADWLTKAWPPLWTLIPDLCCWCYVSRFKPVNCCLNVALFASLKTHTLYTLYIKSCLTVMSFCPDFYPDEIIWVCCTSIKKSHMYSTTWIIWGCGETNFHDAKNLVGSVLHWGSAVWDK